MPGYCADMRKGTKKTKNSTLQTLANPPRDLADFHLRWPEFRPLVVAIAERQDLSGPEREVVRWLLRLGDKVGPQDLV